MSGNDLYYIIGIVFWGGYTLHTIHSLKETIKEQNTLQRETNKDTAQTLDRFRERVRDIENVISKYMDRPYIQRHAEDRPVDVRVIDSRNNK